MNRHWAVFRQDFMGNDFLVEKGLTESRAKELVAEYESHKHHQHYWMTQLPDSPKDFVSDFRDLLSKGSSVACGILVLHHQGASKAELIHALQSIKQIDEPDAREIVESHWPSKR